MSAGEIDDLIARHLEEAGGDLRDCPVNELNRGQATRRCYFIMKIDLVGSTEALRSARPMTYLRVAHPYLSTVDRITQRYGAEAAQTEYHGDGLLALFPQRGNAVEDVMKAAVSSHYAVRRLRRESGHSWLRPKVLLHYAPLIVAMIGPWNESHRVAIGMPIHLVSKKEKAIGAGDIWVSDEFAGELQLADRRVLLQRRTVPKIVTEMVPENPPQPDASYLSALSNPGLGDRPYESTLANLAFNPSPPLESQSTLGSIGGLFGISPEKTYAQQLAEALRTTATNPPRMVSKTRTVQENDGYLVRIVPAYNTLRLPLGVLAGD